MNLPRTILAATDFSDVSEMAVDYAVKLADKLDAKLVLINAIGIPSYGVPELGAAATASMVETVIEDNQAALDRLVRMYAPMKMETLIRTGDPRNMIVQTAKEVGAELIIMGTHGRRGVSRALLGSVAEGVLRHAHCPVLTVRKPG